MNKKNINMCIIHSDYLATKELVYDVCGLTCDNVVIEAESREYGALGFSLNNHLIKFRVGKITPSKVGLFVTLCKRIGEGLIQPFDFEDPIDCFIVSVRSEDHFGQFVFPKEVLFEMEILSKNGKGGKRAMRVYPPWDTPSSKQALKTQSWQCEYFYEIPTNRELDI